MVSGSLLKVLPTSSRLNGYLWSLIASWLILSVVTSASASSDEADLKACRGVAIHANAGTLDQISIPFKAPDRELIDKLQSENRIQELDAALGFDGVANADVFGDGKVKHVLRGLFAGDQRDLEFFDADWNSIEVKQGYELPYDSTTWSMSKERLIQIEQKIYILNETGEAIDENAKAYLYSLDKIGPDHIQRQVCAYTHKIQTKTLVNKNPQLCQAVLDEKPLDYATFDQPHSLPNPLPELDEMETAVSVTSENAADIDILNEGRKVFVVTLGGGHHACEWSSLAILNDAKTMVDKQQTALLDTDLCNTDYHPFKYDGKMYIEEKYLGNRPSYPAITMIKNGRKELICSFKSWAVTIAP